jgi:hypothetical protein
MDRVYSGAPETLRAAGENGTVASGGGDTSHGEGRSAMIELILTVCALSAPSQCEEQRLQFVSQGSVMQCMMQAPPYIAAWSEEHPAARVASWRCAFPGEAAQKI